MEAALRELQIPLTILRPAWYIDNAAWDVASARNTGLIHSFLQPIGKAFLMVAAKDVGHLAAKLIREDWIGSRIVELEGPSRLTPNDLALLCPESRYVQCLCPVNPGRICSAYRE